MKKTILIILATLMVLTGTAFAAQGLTSGDQTIRGHKTFEHNVIVGGTLRANGPTMGISDVGEVYYVGDTWGLDSGAFGDTWDKPFATIDYAIGNCTANKGCIIYVLPWHAETVTTAITVDVAGVSIIGIPRGNNLPTITGNGAIDAITITSADAVIANLRFAGPATDAQLSDINIAAARVSVFNTVHIGSVSTENKVDIITITSAGHDFLIDGVRIYNSVVEVVGGIAIEGAAARGEIRNSAIIDTIGFTNGAITDEATATALYIHHNMIMCGKADTVCVDMGNNSTGVMEFNLIAGRHTTIASNLDEGNAMNFHQNYHLEEAILSAILEPAVDAD